MDDLAHLIELFVHLLFGPFERLLAEVDSVGEQFASFLNDLRIDAFLHFDTFTLKKAAEMLKEFFFIYSVHSRFVFQL